MNTSQLNLQKHLVFQGVEVVKVEVNETIRWESDIILLFV